jgi:hypothetical protein
MAALASGAVLAFPLAVGAQPKASSPYEGLPPELQAMMAAQLDEDVAQARYAACLTPLAERLDGPSTSIEDLVGQVHDLCPEQAKAYLAAHQKLRAAASEAPPPEGDVIISVAYIAVLYAKTHTPPKTEAEVRASQARLVRSTVASIAYSRCMDRAALKADDHASEPTVIARKIVGACSQEAKAESEAMSAGQPADIVASLHERYEPSGRLETARRAVELMRENPHYDD